MPSKRMSSLILECYKKVGLEATVKFLDHLKDLGFKYSTQAAVSMGIKDVTIPDSKNAIIEDAHKKVAVIKKQYEDGIITNGERKSKIISIWTEISDHLSDELVEEITKVDDARHNPLFLMIDSGARGNKSQLMQLGALRGLMAKPTGEIIESPITSNFREGLTVLEYSISSHGAA